MLHFQTERLTLVPATLEIVEAAMNNRTELSKILGLKVPDTWPQPDYAEILPFVAEDLRANPENARWSRIIAHTADSAVIGEIGCKGDPDSTGTIEIGYSIIPEYRGQGYAPEAARALIEWAFRQPGVVRIFADCLPDNAASIRVLQKIGMKQIEPGNGLLRWELLKSNAQAPTKSQ